MVTIWSSLYFVKVVYLFDESVVGLDGAASDASQMRACWHQACLVLECSLPLPPPLLSYFSLHSFSPPLFVQGETRTARVQTLYF